MNFTTNFGYIPVSKTNDKVNYTSDIINYGSVKYKIVCEKDEKEKKKEKEN